jgi:hypothetical protein
MRESGRGNRAEESPNRKDRGCAAFKKAGRACTALVHLREHAVVAVEVEVGGHPSSLAFIFVSSPGSPCTLSWNVWLYHKYISCIFIL